MLWPRPAVCASRPGARHHQATRLLDGDRRIKLVNAARAIEFRPVLKAGSTFFAELLPCLQPGEWTRVHQREPMPAGYTALIAVREPLERCLDQSAPPPQHASAHHGAFPPHRYVSLSSASPQRSSRCCGASSEGAAPKGRARLGAMPSPSLTTPTASSTSTCRRRRG